jgi:hypothetical protein
MEPAAMTINERNALIERCAAVAENELDGNHDGNTRARQIAALLRSMKGEPLAPSDEDAA